MEVRMKRGMVQDSIVSAIDAPTVANYPHQAFSTAHLPVEQRVQAWEKHNADTLIALKCRPPQDDILHAREDNLQLRQVHLARVRGTAHLVERSAYLVEQQPTGSVAVFVSLRGEALFQHAGMRQILRPGDLLVCDADGQFVLGFSTGLDELALRVKWSALPDMNRPGEPLIVRGSEANPYGRAIARLAGSTVGRHVAPPDEQTIIDLLSGLVTRGATRQHVLHRALASAYIEESLRDPQLSAPEVADAVGISDRQLTRIFAATGTTVPRYVLKRRLDLAHSLLTGPDAGMQVTAMVATLCGFQSTSHFSRNFRDRFGIAPGESRRAATQAAATPE